jgi:ABC-type dipeptide/oligopeptide/nickel transport system permease component
VAVALVVGAFGLLLSRLHLSEVQSETYLNGDVRGYLTLDSVDLGNSLHKALLRDVLGDLYRVSDHSLDSLMSAIENARIRQFTDPTQKLGGERKVLSWATLLPLLPMYATFVGVYAIVLVLLYVAGRALAIWRFVTWKQGRSSYVRRYIERVRTGGISAALRRLDLPVKALLRGASYFVLFAPAYVIAYGLRTRVDTENVLFLVVLAVLTNGLLINYANNFFSLMVAESRKGYVQTAIVKGLRSSFDWNLRQGLPFIVIFFPLRHVEGHVFRDIYRNTRLQFLSALKEHAAFLITGLMIIEMALNIRGHLCYTLLQHILYGESELAIVIALGIFFVVKATEVMVDIWQVYALRKYENAD